MTTAEWLLLVGDNLERIRSEGAFAKLSYSRVERPHESPQAEPWRQPPS